MAARIGISAIARVDLVNRAADHLYELAIGLDTTVLLSVWGNLGPTVIRWERGVSSLSTNLGLGSVLPLLHSATGRVFLAHSPNAMISHLLQEECKRSDTSAKEVERIKATVIKNGFAEVSQTFIAGLYAISAPILNWQNEAEAAVTLISTDKALTQRRNKYIPSLLEFTRHISGRGTAD
jgi:DNA-binding IclR family transcriptional regulator